MNTSPVFLGGGGLPQEDKKATKSRLAILHVCSSSSSSQASKQPKKRTRAIIHGINEKKTQCNAVQCNAYNTMQKYETVGRRKE